MVDVVVFVDGDVFLLMVEYFYDVFFILQKCFYSWNGSCVFVFMFVLVVVNKFDLFIVLFVVLVKFNLEVELGRIWVVRSKGLLDLGVGQDDFVVGEEGDWFGGDGSEKFLFVQMMEFDVDVDVIGGSVIGDGLGVEKWWKWIGERV